MSNSTVGWNFDLRAGTSPRFPALQSITANSTKKVLSAVDVELPASSTHDQVAPLILYRATGPVVDVAYSTGKCGILQ